MNINELKSIVEQGKFPFEYKHFAGTGLIIADDPKYTGYSDDIVLCMPHAESLSWLVHNLKDVYQDKIDYMNKFEFYYTIGLKIKEEFSNDGEFIDAMMSVNDEVERRWR
jgi:hypothetical protein